jgi:hypothetical protein
MVVYVAYAGDRGETGDKRGEGSRADILSVSSNNVEIGGNIGLGDWPIEDAEAGAGSCSQRSMTVRPRGAREECCVRPRGGGSVRGATLRIPAACAKPTGGTSSLELMSDCPL